MKMALFLDLTISIKDPRRCFPAHTSLRRPHNLNAGNRLYKREKSRRFLIAELSREARSGAPWVRKCGELPIQENLVITWPYTERASDRPSAPQVYQCKITQSTGTATQMRLKVLFRRKNNNKVVSFSALFFMFTLTWTTAKELERVIENKADEFLRKKNTEIQSGGEEMRMLATSKVKMSGNEN